MQLRLVAFGLLLAGSTAQAGPLLLDADLPDPGEAVHHRLHLRLIEDRAADARPIHTSGMIAQRTVAPNTVLGVGLFKMAPKKLGSGDWRLDSAAPRSRKAAVSLTMRF